MKSPLRIITSLLVCFCLLIGYAFGQHGVSFNYLRDSGFDLEDANKLDSALVLYQAAAKVAEREDNDYDRMTVYTDLAIVHRKLTNYIDCKNYHQRALDLAEKTGDREMVEISLHGLGTLYEHTSDYEKAVQYYLDALRQTQERGDKEGSAVTLQNISKTYMQ